MICLYLKVFDEWDPKNGDIPPYLQAEFLDIEERALAILENWSVEDMRAVLLRIDKLIGRYQNYIEPIPFSQPQNSRIIFPSSPVDQLFACLCSGDLDISDFQDISRRDYLAVLAVALEGQAYLATSDMARYSANDANQIEFIRMQECAELAIAATRAITIAELITAQTALIPGTTALSLSGEVIDKESKKKMLEQQREWGNMPHENTNPLKEIGKPLFDQIKGESPHISNVDAAKEMLRRNSEFHKIAFRTLQNWITDWKSII